MDEKIVDSQPVQIPPKTTVALVLQGGGALGSYQAGVCEGLLAAKVDLDWVAGISIGAINAALIVGNPPEKRLERLREFWTTVCAPSSLLSLPYEAEQALFGMFGNDMRKAVTAIQATQTMLYGQSGFFSPRLSAMGTLSGDPAKASYYDTAPLQQTLLRLCDFDRINNGDIRFSVGAVNVRTGNFAYFENYGPNKTRIGPEHIMASGALPPGFAAVRIGDDYYWDGGLVSNTPLDQVLRHSKTNDTLVFQVDLWSAVGPVPDNLLDVSNRMKDIQYSSRTRHVTDQMQERQRIRRLLREVLNAVPEDKRKDNDWCKIAAEVGNDKRYTVLHLIYKNKEYEGHYKDYQFSMATMEEHWHSGLDDILRTLDRKEWLEMPTNKTGFVTHDIHRLLK